jgi:hypothetical protein
MSRSRHKQVETADEQPIATSVTDEATEVTPEQIAERAYALYLARGAEDGHDVEDWLQAERDLRESSLLR